MNKKFCTIRNMNYTGEIMHGDFKSDKDGDYYLLDDGDSYSPEQLKIYNVTFLDEDPRLKLIKCHWTHNDLYDYYSTECGNDFIMNDGTPSENDFKFCPYCGGEIIEVHP